MQIREQWSAIAPQTIARSRDPWSFGDAYGIEQSFNIWNSITANKLSVASALLPFAPLSAIRLFLVTSSYHPLYFPPSMTNPTPVFQSPPLASTQILTHAAKRLIPQLPPKEGLSFSFSPYYLTLGI